MNKNIKLKVTPEQSRKVQKICFSKGIVWGGAGAKIAYTDAPYLYIEGGRYLYYGREYEDYKADRREEMDANIFIQTNDTGIRKLLKQKVIKWKRL